MKRKIPLVGALGLVFLLWGTVARLQGQPQPSAASSRPVAMPVSPEILWQDFREIESILQSASASRDDVDALLKRFNGHRLDLGIESPEVMSLALVADAERATRKGDYGAARRFLDVASSLTPNLGPIAFAQASLEFAESPFNFFSALSHLIEGYNTKYHQFWGSLFLAGNILLWLSKTMMAFSLVFVLVLFLKYSPILLHDFRELLPHEWNALGVTLLGCTVLLFPVFAGTGLVIVGAFWLILVWPYAQMVERITIGAILLLLLLTPFFLTKSASYFAVYSDYLLHGALYVNKGGYSPEVVKILEAEAQRKPAESLYHFYLGQLYKRQGGEGLLHAVDDMKRSINYNHSFLPALVNLGNVYFNLNQSEEAREQWEKARGIDPERASVYYNLGLYWFEKLQFQKGEEETRKAVKYNPGLVDSHNAIYRQDQHNRNAIDERISEDVLEEKLDQSMSQQEVDTGNLWSEELFGVTSDSLLLLVLAVAGLMPLGEMVRKKFLFISHRCAMCSRPMCEHCDEGTKTPYCPQCNETFFGPRLDPVMREARKSWIYKRDIARQITSYVLTLVIPGTGHILQEKDTLGIVLSFTWIGCLLWLIFNRYAMETPLYLFDFTTTFRYTLFAIIAVVLYGFSFLTLRNEV